MTELAMGQQSDTWETAWECALDELELDIDTAEAMLLHTAPHPDTALPWTPTVLEGPLPERLVPRARRLLQRQLDAAHALALAASKTRRELDVLARFEEPAGRTPAVYVDRGL